MFHHGYLFINELRLEKRRCATVTPIKIIGVSNIMVGMLVVAISIPLVTNKVPMNQIYGIRFKQSFESQEKWYEINRYGGRQLIVWSIPLILLGVATFFLPLAGRSFWTTASSLAPLIYLVPVFLSYLYARHLS